MKVRPNQLDKRWAMGVRLGWRCLRTGVRVKMRGILAAWRRCRGCRDQGLALFLARWNCQYPLMSHFYALRAILMMDHAHIWGLPYAVCWDDSHEPLSGRNLSNQRITLVLQPERIAHPKSLRVPGHQASVWHLGMPKETGEAIRL